MISARSLSESTSTSKWERRRSTPASEIDSRTRTLTPPAEASACSRDGGVLERLERGGDCGPALDVRAEFGEHELDRGEHGRDVEHVEPADVPDPEDLPFQRPLTVGDRHPEPLAQGRDDGAGLDAVRRADRGDDRAAVVVGREQLEPHRLRARAASAAKTDVPLEDGLEALVEQKPEGDVERDDHRGRRREGSVELRLRLLRPLPVEVEAAAPLARGERL